MSKIANQIISIPPNVKVNLSEGKISVEGPLGRSEELNIPSVVKVIKEEEKMLTKAEKLENIALVGTYNSLIHNMIKGVVEGYREILEVKGVGYKVVLEQDNKLKFTLGKSHLIEKIVPRDLKVKVEGSKIIIEGLDKQKVRMFAANNIRPLRLPSVYKKSKGIYYKDEEENIRLKPGKSLNK